MPEPRPARRHRVLSYLALAAHLAVGVVPYAGSGLVAPTGGVVVLWAVWLSLLAVLLVLVRAGRALALAVPVAAVIVWVVVVSLGDLLLGWTA